MCGWGGGGGGVVACRIIVSAPVPVPFLWTLDFGFVTLIWDLDLGLDLGLTIDKGCINAFRFFSLFNIFRGRYEWRDWTKVHILELE